MTTEDLCRDPTMSLCKGPWERGQVGDNWLENSGPWQQVKDQAVEGVDHLVVENKLVSPLKLIIGDTIARVSQERTKLLFLSYAGVL